MGALAAGVALPAQELGDLSFEGDLKKQPEAEPGYVLEDLAEFAARVEELIDLSTDAVAGQYSS